MLPYISAIVAKYGGIRTRLEYNLIISYTIGIYAYNNHLEYRSHTKSAFLKLNTLTIADLVKFKSMVLMYNLMTSNILSYLCMVHESCP